MSGETLGEIFNCDCVRAIAGSWADAGLNRICLLGTHDSLSALKGCPKCDGTGKMKVEMEEAAEEGAKTANLVIDWLKAKSEADKLGVELDDLDKRYKEANHKCNDLYKELLDNAPKDGTAEYFVHEKQLIVVSNNKILIQPIAGVI